MDDEALQLGEEVNWNPARRPVHTSLRGAHVLLRPVAPATDAEPLFAVSHPPDGDPAIWTYLPYGPYESPGQMRAALTRAAASADPVYFTLAAPADGRPLGIASYLRIKPEHGVVEVGHIWFSGMLRRTTAATEAIYLLARHAFDELGYRRLEWKCNALNEASRGAAERFGFTFEGVFRKHMVLKGRSRDTAWYAITDDEWPAIRIGFEVWLASGNFDRTGRQKRSLREVIEEARAAPATVSGGRLGSPMIDKLDFVAIPSQDAERSRSFYVDTLGLRPDDQARFEFWIGETCCGIWEPERMGRPFAPQNNAHLALHVDDVSEAQAELEAKGVLFAGEILDTGVCRMAFFVDPDGNDLMLHHRYAPRD